MSIRLIIGLGNPGKEYSSTRHNAGFWFIDRIAAKYNITPGIEAKFLGIAGKFNYQGRDIFLLKPQTYMNLSGKSVLAIMNFYKILPAEILVVHDELDFLPGIVKFKQGGGNGGHNGIKDIDRVIGQDYWRLRIGIGHPGDKDKVAGYVLKNPGLNEKIDIDNAIDKAMQALELFLAGELNTALKQLHSQ